jgi:colanic acid/amylovoran biosynthesis glycosyltransferase
MTRREKSQRAARHLRVAHVVRDYGGITEPFIESRVMASADAGELWYESAKSTPPIRSRQIVRRWMRPGSVGDLLFHRVPAIGRIGAGAYGRAEELSRPDVVHAHYLTTGFLLSIATVAPLVVSAYGFDLGVLSRRQAWRQAIAHLASRVSALFVEGPYMRRSAIEVGFDPRAVVVIPISAGLDRLPFVRPSHRRPLDGDAPIRVVVCGRFVEKKGHDIALEAFDQVYTGLPAGSALEIIGDGPLRSELMRGSARLASAKAIEFKGLLRRTEYLARLASADLLLVGSRTARNGDTEGGAPTTILDAHALGVPVVATGHADIPFLVREGRTGYLAAEGDSMSLSNALLRALRDRQTWDMVALEARRQVDHRHSDRAVATSLSVQYERVRT